MQQKAGHEKKKILSIHVLIYEYQKQPKRSEIKIKKNKKSELHCALLVVTIYSLMNCIYTRSSTDLCWCGYIRIRQSKKSLQQISVSIPSVSFNFKFQSNKYQSKPNRKIHGYRLPYFFQRTININFISILLGKDLKINSTQIWSNF